MKLPGWRVEYTITLLIVFTAVLLFIPTSLQSTVQANLITKWKDCYNKLTYVQDVILKQEKQEILTSFRRAKTAEEREELFREILKPYFRLYTTKATRRYHTKFMNGDRVGKDSIYYFTDYYFTDKKMIVGIKDIPNTNKTESLFLMTFDVNGILPPNTWGKDIYGVDIRKEKIEPFGAHLSMEELKKDCSPAGTGLGCSYYYNIGGGFDE